MTNMSKRTCILVLGMHRSGTSALTRLINLLGAALPENILGANLSNERGHWEPAEIIALNDAFLAAIGSRWDDWSAIDFDTISQAVLNQYKTDLKILLDRLISGDSLFVLKDPRICRLLPVYKDVFEQLDIGCKSVIITRNPLEVSASLMRRDGMIQSQSKMLWLRHMLEAVSNTKEMTRSYVTYSTLLSDWKRELSRVMEELDVNFPKTVEEIEAEASIFLTTSLRHFNEADASLGTDLIAKTWVSDCYSALLKLSEGRAVQTAGRRMENLLEEMNRYTPFIRAILADLQNANELEKRNQKDTIRELEKHKLELHSQLQQTKSTTGELALELNTLREQKSLVDSELQSYKLDISSMQKDRDSLRADRDSLRMERDRVREERDAIRVERDNLNRAKVLAYRNDEVDELKTKPSNDDSTSEQDDNHRPPAADTGPAEKAI